MILFFFAVGEMSRVGKVVWREKRLSGGERGKGEERELTSIWVVFRFCCSWEPRSLLLRLLRTLLLRAREAGLDLLDCGSIDGIALAC